MIDLKAFMLIKQFEGLRLKAYVCPAGVWTIGYGHTGPDVSPGSTITAEKAEDLLSYDLAKFERAVTSCLHAPTTPLQLGAMVSLAFNIGVGGFKQSSVLRLHNAGDPNGAARAFLLWNKATVDGRLQELPGLTRRRNAEAALYLEGWQQNHRDTAMPQAIAAPDTAVHSRTYWGQGAVIAGTGGTGIVESMRDWLSTAQDGAMQLHTYLPYIQTALIVLAVAGVALTLYAKWSDRQASRLS